MMLAVAAGELKEQGFSAGIQKNIVSK